jgi:bacterioferritin
MNTEQSESTNKSENYFLRDVSALREGAQKSLKDGAVTAAYGGDVEQTISLLQSALATEIVCILRYTMNSISVVGIASKSVAAEFQSHADDERVHMMKIAERINQLGGEPDFDPSTLTARSATEYGGGTLIDMVKQNLIAERIAIAHYTDLIGYFSTRDPTTRLMLEQILNDEEDHAADMHDLLVAHQGVPMLPPE